MILKLQPAFFQTPQLHLFMAKVAYQGINYQVEVPMFDFEFDDAASYILWDHVFFSFTETWCV